MPTQPALRLLCSAMFLVAVSLQGADWPMWRANPGRTATVAEALPQNLQVLWKRDLPPLKPAYQDVRLQFDGGYEPVVLGKRLFLGSSHEDSITAYDTETGAELWKVYADGPIRFAPVAAEGRVIFGSDDGSVRCVAADSGKLIWQKRAVPSDRQVLGNGRLISVWPIRGGPVLHEGRVYFAAGVWPIEGVFVFCVDAATGKTIWLNDRAAYIYGIHPHGAEAFGGLAPQGYLLVDGTELVVPSSSAYPARLDLATGELKHFALPKTARLPGGWFAAAAETNVSANITQKLPEARLLFDSSVNANRHEDKQREQGVSGVLRTFRAGGKQWSFDDVLPGVSGTIHSMIAADAKCFVTTEEGALYALASRKSTTGTPKHWEQKRVNSSWTADAAASQVLSAAQAERGHCVALGLGGADFLATLARESQLKVVALVPEGADIGGARKELLSRGIACERVALRQVSAAASGLPPYMANLVVIAPGTALPDSATMRQMYSWVRPFGGRMVGSAGLAKVAEELQLPHAKIVNHTNALVVITRERLEGSANYLGDWRPTSDPLVKAPVGVLWFDDKLGHFKRSPQPKFIDGVMVSSDKEWLDASTRKGALDYRLMPAVFSDVYTGRILATNEAMPVRELFSGVDLKVQPSQYRPKSQKDAWKPDAPRAGTRVNPLTGENEPRTFPKSYGCDGGYDYGLLYTMRSGTAAFYDKQLDSGTIHISGPRSGCTSSVIPANGVLNVPYYYKGCSCSYPLPAALALVSMPPTFEQWASWGETPMEELAGKIERIGLNFGAPGDRRTEDGTLWLDYPSVGGPSPKLDIKTEPAAPATFYRHSVWMEGGEGWPWVAASGFRGLRKLTLSGLKNGTYTVRLTFVEPEAGTSADQRQFDVRIQNAVACENLSIIAAAGGAMRSVTKTSPKVAVTNGVLTLALDARQGETLISGLELIRDGLTIGALPKDARVPGKL